MNVENKKKKKQQQNSPLVVDLVVDTEAYARSNYLSSRKTNKMRYTYICNSKIADCNGQDEHNTTKPSTSKL
jgi:hypothetical protein